MKNIKIYENYHSRRKIQKRLIKSNDFTYNGLLYFLNKYFKPKMKILDIGCGVGTIDLYLANNGASVLGIDVSQNGIDIARKNSENLGLRKNLKFDIMNFPYQAPSEKYDIVICSEVLEHLVDDKNAVKKIFALLKPNGVVIASSPSVNSILYRFGKLKKFDKEVGHLRRYDEKGFKSLFTSSGLRIMEVKKTQGFMRDILFTTWVGGVLLRVINKRPFSAIFTYLDDLTIPLFGESDILLAAKKI